LIILAGDAFVGAVGVGLVGGAYAVQHSLVKDFAVAAVGGVGEWGNRIRYDSVGLGDWSGRLSWWLVWLGWLRVRLGRWGVRLGRAG